ncbi:MAG: hypothetical protein K5922_10255 [Clostridiales bacterium]|nr:hypothetical protein [Clostridiales bacterium]
MERLKRFLVILTAAVMLNSVGSRAEYGAEEFPEEGWELEAAEEIPEEGWEWEAAEEIPEEGWEWEAAERDEEYWALSMWMGESEGTVNLYDRDSNPLELDEEMRFSGGTFLETEKESLAVVDMDRERLAIMDEISRAGFEKTDLGDRISITLQNGAMYFRVGELLEEKESFDVTMEDIRLAIRGTCGMAQKNEDGLSFLLASGQAVITKIPENEDESDRESGGITIGAGEAVSIAEENGEIRFEKRRLAEDEVPDFLLKAFRKDTRQLEKVYAETGWDPEKLFGEDIPMWMPPARELDGVPEEWVGKVFGAGGWFGDSIESVSFPSDKEIALNGNAHPLISVRQYTEHYYELCYEERREETGYKGFILPGLTEEEVRLLRRCDRVAGMPWNIIRGSGRYVTVEFDGYNTPAWDGFGANWFYEDITAAGADGAKPFVDYQPCGYNLEIVDGRPSELPDVLVGKTLVVKRTSPEFPDGEEIYQFISKNSLRHGSTLWYWVSEEPKEVHTHKEPLWETIINLEVWRHTDHWYSILGHFRDGPDGISIEFILPGVTEREAQYIRELMEAWMYNSGNREVSFPGLEEGRFYTIDTMDGSIRELEVR